MDSLALTDSAAMFGAITFYQNCLQAGVKPILGYEAFVAPGSRHDHSGGMRASGNNLTLLARNLEGYHNLVKIASRAYTEGFYYRPRVDHELLAEHHQGLLALSGAGFGLIPMALSQGDRERAKMEAQALQNIFGEDYFYLELHRHGLPGQDELVSALKELGQTCSMPLVATNNVHYIRKEDAPTHDVLMCIGSGKLISDPGRQRWETEEMYLKSPQDMAETFADLPEAITHTTTIAEQCNVELDFQSKHMPAFDTPDHQKAEDYLEALVQAGLKERYPALQEDVRERAQYELNVIKQLGFASYFLIVWDLIKYARDHAIPVGPGRGSCVGSIVSYALGISDLCPLKYDLIFERFLNPDRISDPDIDIDFCMDRREEVIEYVRQKYGRESVAQIATFGTMAARGVLRDVGRVMNIPLDDVDRVAKMIPDELNITLHKALKVNPELKEWQDRDDRIKTLFQHALQLEGVARHVGTHAAGIVLADAPLTEYIPLYKSGDTISTQYEWTAVEACGILKMDFLGLRTLTAIDHCLKAIKQSRGKTIDINTIPLDDQGTFDMLSQGKSRGVFQLESEGMRELLQNMKPDSFSDIIVLIALYRPGPLGSGMVDEYVQCKHGARKPKYLHPCLEAVLSETHGVIAYQEQVMRIANTMSGFSLADADNLRKAMSKKKPEMMERFRAQFISGAGENDIDESIAQQVFEQIEFFAGYGFNKSHSAAYGLVSYRTAWLKHNYTAEFLASQMTCEIHNTDKIADYIEECRRLNITVLPPCVIESDTTFTVTKANTIRFGLAAIKGVGIKAVEHLIQVRNDLHQQQQRSFKDFWDFCESVDVRLINKGVLEALVKAGAFDSLNEHRAQLWAAIELGLALGQRASRDRRQGQTTLFSLFDEQGQGSPQLPPEDPWPDNHKLLLEKESLGFYISSHPLAEHADMLTRLSSGQLSELSNYDDKQPIVIGGLILQSRTTLVKRGRFEGQKMALFQFEDLNASVNAVMFSEAFKTYGHLIEDDRCVFARGRVDKSREQASIVIDEIIPMSRAWQELTRQVTLRVHDSGLDDAIFNKLKGVLSDHKGPIPVVFEIVDHHKQVHRVRVGRHLNVLPSSRLSQDIEEVIGAGHLILS